MFQVLGDVSVDSSSRIVLPPGRRLKCLLGVLLVELGRPVSVERLIRLLWDRVPPSTAETMVCNNVWRLRQILAAEPMVTIRTVGSDYQLLVEPDQVDLHRFRRLVREAGSIEETSVKADRLFDALALWRGSLFGGVASERIRYLLSTPLDAEHRDAELAYHEVMSDSPPQAAVAGRTEKVPVKPMPGA